MQQGKYLEFISKWVEHIFERISHFFRAFTPMKFMSGTSFFFEFIIVYFFSEDGKFSLNNKLFTGFLPAGWNSVILIVQYVWNAWINKWWAKGNILIIFD